jgi:molybdopterin converting factor subunit 1
MIIKCFGIARDITNADHIAVGKDGPGDVQSLRLWLLSKYPSLKKVNGFMIAVNQEYAEETMTICDQDEIAIIPPVSGG